MDNQTPQFNQYPTPQPVGSAAPKRSKKKQILVVLLIFLLAAVSGYPAYSWNKEKSDANSLRDQLSAAQKPAETADAEDAAPAATEAKPEEGVKYSTDVGKFNLSLPAGYTVVQTHNGSGEGAASTQLYIAKKTNTQDVVSAESYGRVEIKAVTNNGVTNFDEFLRSVLSNWAGGETKLADTTVGGVKALQYNLAGLGLNRSLFFEKNGINYEIHAISIESVAVQKDFDAVVKGFSFK